MYAKYVKRYLDFWIALIALIILSPVLIALTVIGTVKMKGNPFFTQERPGWHEKIFKLIKFRTMTNEKDKDGKPTKNISSRWYDWGTGPMVTEGIPATVILPSAAGATKCWALDESGARMKEVPVKRGASGKAILEIGPEYRTVWYEITVQ